MTCEPTILNIKSDTVVVRIRALFGMTMKFTYRNAHSYLLVETGLVLLYRGLKADRRLHW